MRPPPGASRDTQVTPESRPALRFDGNSAHSSGYWWEKGGAMYFGGELVEDRVALRGLVRRRRLEHARLDAVRARERRALVAVAVNNVQDPVNRRARKDRLNLNRALVVARPDVAQEIRFRAEELQSLKAVAKKQQVR